MATVIRAKRGEGVRRGVKPVMGMRAFEKVFGKPEYMDDDDIKANNIPDERVWSLTQGDGGDGLCPGWSRVNNFGRMVAPVPRRKAETELIEWVDYTGRVYEIVCDNKDCPEFGETSSTYSAIENPDGTYTCAECEKKGQKLRPGKYIDGVD